MCECLMWVGCPSSSPFLGELKRALIQPRRIEKGTVCMGRKVGTVLESCSYTQHHPKRNSQKHQKSHQNCPPPDPCLGPGTPIPTNTRCLVTAMPPHQKFTELGDQSAPAMDIAPEKNWYTKTGTAGRLSPPQSSAPGVVLGEISSPQRGSQSALSALIGPHRRQRPRHPPTQPPPFPNPLSLPSVPPNPRSVGAGRGGPLRSHGRRPRPPRRPPRHQLQVPAPPSLLFYPLLTPKHQRLSRATPGDPSVLSHTLPAKTGHYPGPCLGSRHSPGRRSNISSRGSNRGLIRQLGRSLSTTSPNPAPAVGFAPSLPYPTQPTLYSPALPDSTLSKCTSIRDLNSRIKI